jgi:hypothetical protein
VVQEKSCGLSEEQVLTTVHLLANYLREGKGLYGEGGQELCKERRLQLMSFFAPVLLDQVRTVELADRRIANPEFYVEAKARGCLELPDITHLASVTFVDTIVFHGALEERILFHELVHATQIRLLGLQRYAELLVRGFVRTRSYFMVPMKAHAFELDARFAKNPRASFSVVEEVWKWAEGYRY